MKITFGVLLVAVGLGTAWGQNPDVIQNTKNTLQNVQMKQTIDENAALATAGQASNSAASQPAAAAKPAPSKPVASNSAAPSAQKQVAVAPAKPAVTASANSAKAAAHKKPAKKQSKTTVAVSKPAEPKNAVAVEDKAIPEDSKKKEPREYSAAGRRDPFVSPVVTHMASGSGCSAGKRCLAVDQIILTGIVKSETGMIAVVVNSMNKAYFLRENDPVFNGYVVKITGDSIIFNQTVEDKLGKPFTREVTKKIATPAV
jgi:Tfp pilus assembly protein PilP